MNAPEYQFTIRTPEMQAKRRRRCRLKRVAVAASIAASFLINAGIADAMPVACDHSWIC